MSIVPFVVIPAVAAIGYVAGREVPLDAIWAYFEALRTTGSIVFGVMGALLAIVYPEVVKKGFRSAEPGMPSDLANITYITNPLAQSAVLLVLLVILGPIFAWSKAHFEDEFAIRGIAFGLLAMLSAWQVWILLLVLRPLDLLHSHSTLLREKGEMRRRIHTNLKK